MQPAPERPTSWRTFVRSHAHLIVAADFFTTEVWTTNGLVRNFTLFFIDLATREVCIAGTREYLADLAQKMGRNRERTLATSVVPYQQNEEAPLVHQTF